MWRRITVMSSSVSASSATMKSYGPSTSRTKALGMVHSRSLTAPGRTSSQSRYAITKPAYYPTNVIPWLVYGLLAAALQHSPCAGGLGGGEHHITLLTSRISVSAPWVHFGNRLHHSGSQTMDYSGSQILRRYRLGSHAHQYRRHRSSAPLEAGPR